MMQPVSKAPLLSGPPGRRLGSTRPINEQDARKSRDLRIAYRSYVVVRRGSDPRRPSGLPPQAHGAGGGAWEAGDDLLGATGVRYPPLGAAAATL